jgi:hypothetical protein
MMIEKAEGKGKTMFEFTDGVITGYTGTAQEVAIPESINGQIVTGIGKAAFAVNHLTSVVIPDSVISIGEYAFFRNHLTSVTLGENVTLDESRSFSDNFDAFYNANKKKAGTYTHNEDTNEWEFKAHNNRERCQT